LQLARGDRDVGIARADAQSLVRWADAARHASGRMAPTAPLPAGVAETSAFEIEEGI
jgi:hypothetical protein